MELMDASAEKTLDAVLNMPLANGVLAPNSAAASNANQTPLDLPDPPFNEVHGRRAEYRA